MSVATTLRIGFPVGMALLGDALYIVGHYGSEIYDAVDPFVPTLARRVPGASVASACLAGNLLYTCDYGALKIYDLQDASRAPLVGSCAANDALVRVEVSGTTACLGKNGFNSPPEVIFLDVAAPSKPRVMARFAGRSWTHSFAVPVPGAFLCADYDAGFFVVRGN
jgi:hypothetical protein